MGGTSTISGGKLCLRIDPRVPTLSGCAASRGAGVQPGAHLDAERLDRVADRHRAADRPLRAVEHREEPVARCVHLAAGKRTSCASNSRSAARTSSRACPANGASSPSLLNVESPKPVVLQYNSRHFYW